MIDSFCVYVYDISLSLKMCYESILMFWSHFFHACVVWKYWESKVRIYRYGWFMKSLWFPVPGKAVPTIKIQVKRNSLTICLSADINTLLNPIIRVPDICCATNQFIKLHIIKYSWCNTSDLISIIIVRVIKFRHEH